MSVDETLMCSFQVRMRHYSEHAHEYQGKWLECGVDQFLLIFTQFVSQFDRFSNLRTRSSFTVVQGVWALDVQSLPQGKPRNDACSLPLTSTLSPPALSTSSLLSFTKQPEIKPLPRAFFPFLSVLLKTFNVPICLNKWACECGCVRAQMTKASHVPIALKPCVRVSVLCERFRFLLFPPSLTTPPVERLKPQCLSVQ